VAPSVRRTPWIFIAATALVCGLTAGCASHASRHSPTGERTRVVATIESYVRTVSRSDWRGTCRQLLGFAFRQFDCYVTDDLIPGPYAHVRRGAEGVRIRVFRVNRVIATASLTGPGMSGGDGEYTPQFLVLGRNRSGRWHVRFVRVPRATRGVHGDIGESIVGTPYRTIVRRFGEPEQVRRTGRELCGNWDTVGDPYDWQFCFRHGVMDSAMGNQ